MQYPFAIPERLIPRLPSASRDGYVYADVRFRSTWEGILVIDAMHRCVGVFVGRKVVQHPLPFAPEEIEDFRPPSIGNRLLARLPASIDPFSAGAFLVVVGCPAALTLVFVSRWLALVLPVVAVTGIWLMYQVAGFPFLRLPIALLGIGWAVAGIVVLF